MELQATVVNSTDFGFEYVPKLIGGILVLFIGLWITNLITKGLKIIETRKLISLLSLLTSITNIILKILVAITVME
jgi:small conductance mechanosensitive channel